MFFLCYGFISATLLCLFLPTLWVICLVCFSIFIISFCLVAIKRRLSHRLGLAGFGFCIGCLWLSVNYIDYFQSSILYGHHPTTVRAKLIVESVVLPQVDFRESFSINVRVASVKNEEEIQPVNLKLSINSNVLSELDWTRLQSIEMNDVLDATIKLRPITSYENQTGYRYQTWALLNNIHYSAYIVNLHHIIERVPCRKQVISTDLYDLTSDLSQQKYMLALGLGNRSEFNDQDFKQLQNAGIAHLFAISGLHIGIIFFIIKVLSQLIVKHISGHLPFVVIDFSVLIFTWTFVGISGWQTSAVRASLLLTVWFIMHHGYWHFNYRQMLTVLTVASLIYNPFIMLEPAWLLSMSAIISIYVYLHLIPTNMKWRSKGSDLFTKFFYLGCHYLYQLVGLQLMITLLMLPLTIWLFDGISISGLVNNLWAIPLFSFVIIPTIFVSLIVLPFSSELAKPGFVFANMLLDKSVHVINMFDGLSNWWSLSSSLSVVVVMCVFIMFYHRLFNKSILLFTGLAATLIVFIDKNIPTDHWKFSMLDVGQGLAIAINGRDSVLLYDLGPIYLSGFNATKAVVLPYLSREAKSKIDIVISHFDTDHKGNVFSLMPRFNSEEISLVNCKLGRYIWQHAEITIIAPDTLKKSDKVTKNDSSCVIKIQLAQHMVVLPGDISSAVERKLLKNSAFQDQAVTILVSSHHGSRHSNSPEFLQSLNPDFLLHSAGKFNQFGFPTEEVVNLANRLNIQQLSTVNRGQIDFILGHFDSVITKTQLSEWTPFWQRENPFSIQAEIR